MRATASLSWLCILFHCSSIEAASFYRPGYILPAEIAKYPTNSSGKLLAVAKIYNSQRSNRQGWTEECYGAFIDFKLVVTACSCVSYTDDARTDITPWFHGNVSQVLPVKTFNLFVGTMFYEFHPRRTRVAVKSVLLHPKCDNYYHVDYAILILHQKHPRAQPIPLSAAANADLVREKMKALPTISGKDDGCTVFHWTERGVHWRMRQDTVKFQPWDMCYEHVCPAYRPPLTPNQPHKQNLSECQNKIGSGSRHCLEWTANADLCKVPPGSPLFCNFDNFKGVWGLMVNGRYSCPPLGGALGILNGLDAAIDWIRSVYIEHKKTISLTPTSETLSVKRMGCEDE